MTQTAFAENVFTWPSDTPQLIGARCTECAAVAFPFQSYCPRCGSAAVNQELLPREGTIHTFTVQSFFPKAPYASGETAETFQPFGVGLVQLGDVVRVEGRLTVADAGAIQIGMAVRVVVVAFRTEPDGSQVMTYAFEPID